MTVEDVAEISVQAGQENEDVDRAHDRALGFLGFRPRSAHEVERYLRQKGFGPQTVEIVRERLTSAGLLDDGQFAEYWISNRSTFSPRGRRALRQELRQKGLASDAIDRAMEESPDEAELAIQAGRKRLSTFARLEQDEFRRRMMGFLSRRGFGYGEAHEATKRLWEEVVSCEL